MNKNFSQEQLDQLKVFHLRGGIVYAELNIAHKAMMWLAKKEAERKPVENRDAEDRILLETYGGKLDFTDKNTTKPLIEYVQKIPRHTK